MVIINKNQGRGQRGASHVLGQLGSCVKVPSGVPGRGAGPGRRSDAHKVTAPGMLSNSLWVGFFNCYF